MNKGWFASVLALLAGAGALWAQPLSPLHSLAAPAPACTGGPVLDTPFCADGPSSCLGEGGSPLSPDAEEWDSRSGPAKAGGAGLWVSAEYLLWWIKDSRVPPLVTTGPPGSGGVLPASGTSVLFGGSAIDNEERSGGRFAAGLWLNECDTFGLEGSYFFLGSRSVPFGAASAGAPGSPLLARPFFNVLRDSEDAQLVAFPGQVAGNVNVVLSSRLQGAEANTVCNLCRQGCCSGGYRVDLLGGFRYLQLNEGLGITEDVTVLPGSLFLGGGNARVSDQFDTRNDFYGGQLGLRAEWRRGRLFANVRGLAALGNTHEVVHINGTTVLTSAGGASTTASGGLLAQPSNSGRFVRDNFAVVPEAGVNVGCALTDHLRALVGYTFLYVSDVARPGDQIDRGLNVRQLPTTLPAEPVIGPARPAFTFRDSDFWAQGINFGLEWRY